MTTTSAQLTFDGAPPRRPRSLTERQRDLLRYVRHEGTIYTHWACGHYRDPYGALRRLEGMGYVRRGRKRTEWVAT